MVIEEVKRASPAAHARPRQRGSAKKKEQTGVVGLGINVAACIAPAMEAASTGTEGMRFVLYLLYVFRRTGQRRACRCE